jgi:hypothetical protein
MLMNKNALALALTAALATPALAKPVFGPEFAGSVPAGPGTPHFRYPAHSRAPSSAVLYDQSGVFAGVAPAQDYQSAYDEFDSEGADDFVVTDAAGWTVSAFNFQVAFLYPSSPADPLYHINVYEDDNGLPGATACGYTSLAGALDASRTSLSVSLPTPCVLPTGRYWVGMSADLVYPPKMYWTTGLNGAIDNIGAWREPGDGNQTGCTTWAPMSACTVPGGPTVGEGSLNLLFQVIGSVGSASGGSCDPGELCLLTTVGTDPTPGVCADADTIDATVGDQLNFCYTLTNNTGIALDYHTLQNNVDGALFSLLHHSIPDGATFQFNHLEIVGQTNTYNSTWTGQDIRPGYMAELEGGGGDCSDRIFADGFDDDASSCSGSNFVDITNTGTPLGLGDDSGVDVAMPFSFNFYGTTSNLISISNNGGIFFAPGWSLSFLNEALPSIQVGAPAIMPLWDDFASTQGDVYYETRGIAPNRKFIVEWFDLAHGSGPNNDGATFELILGEDGSIEFEYADVAYTAFGNFTGDPEDCTAGVCATIGLQNDMALYNQFSALEASIADHSGIRWEPASPQTLSATDSVTVNVGAPQIVINPDPIAGSVTAGGSATIPFDVENHGTRDLNWNLAEAASSNLHFPPPGSRFSMPLGDPAKMSAGPAPSALRHASANKSKGSRFHLPFSGGVPVFAYDLPNAQFETFDALTPGAVNVVAQTESSMWVGGAFVNGDFSKFYVLGGTAFVPLPNGNTLARIDTTTGARTIIGTADDNGYGWNGMAWDSTTGKLFAVSGCGTNSKLVTLDISSGAVTPVGSLPNEFCTVAIAIDGNGDMYGLDLAAQGLFAIDKTSGADALIGSVGFNANFAQDMAFDQSTGILYLAGFDADSMTGGMYTVDVTTGLATLIGPQGASSGEIDAMGIETIGGPCGQEQDLPWLSLSPSNGTTPPAGSSPITASIDATGANAGDVLSGTVCAHSNDPAQPNHVLATPITVDVN